MVTLQKNHVDNAVVQILNTLSDNGHDAYLVGGAVRDIYFGITPKDYDIATSATPRQVKRIFGKQARIIGRRFRLAHIYFGREYYEVSTFRREPTAEERSSRPEDDGTIIWQDNQFGTLEEDAFRRDFTVNALYSNPVQDGKVIDKVNGLVDLQNATVKTINDPETCIAEDPVRIIRALKLVARYKFTLAPELAKVIDRHKADIQKSSPSRLFEEVLKIFSTSYAQETLETFHQYGLLHHYLPFLDEIWQTEAGEIIRKLLTERDNRKKGGWYSNSRTLALITVAFPAVAEELGIPAVENLNDYQPELPVRVRDSVRNMFSPLPVPKTLSSRSRDAILLLPDFLSKDHQNRLLHHPEYRYARELFSLLTTVLEWDPEIIEQWPNNGKWRPKRKKKKTRRGKHSKKGHHKKVD